MRTKIIKSSYMYHFFYEENKVFKFHSAYSKMKDAKSARDSFKYSTKCIEVFFNSLIDRDSFKYSTKCIEVFFNSLIDTDGDKRTKGGNKNMKIIKILTQMRRDFSAIFECEHCGDNEEKRGCYDDSYFHQKVIPAMKCKSCGKEGDKDYRPLTTKYDDGVQI